MSNLCRLSHLELLRITCGGCVRTHEMPSRFMPMTYWEEVKVRTLPYRLRHHKWGYRGKTKEEILADQFDIGGSYFVYHDINLKRPL